MNEPLPNLVSGRWGRVTAQHMNSVFRAVEDYRAQPLRGNARHDGRRTYVAKLSTSASTTAISGFTTWNWTGVSVASAAISSDTDLVQSSDFSTAGGTAIDLDGNAAANDIVLLHEVVAKDGARWFAFQSGGGGTATAAYPGYLITAASADATGSTPSWVYTLQPITGISSGSWTASGATVRARNLAEDQTYYQHGQDLTLSSGTLTPAAVQGPVNAWNTGLTEAAADLWAFDVPNPMTVACSSDIGFGDPFDFLLMGAS